MDSAFNKDVVLVNTDAVPSKRLVSFMNSQFHLTHLNVNFVLVGYKTSLYLMLIREKHMIQPCIVNQHSSLEWKSRLDNFLADI